MKNSWLEISVSSPDFYLSHYQFQILLDSRGLTRSKIFFSFLFKSTYMTPIYTFYSIQIHMSIHMSIHVYSLNSFIHPFSLPLLGVALGTKISQKTKKHHCSEEIGGVHLSFISSFVTALSRTTMKLMSNLLLWCTDWVDIIRCELLLLDMNRSIHKLPYESLGHFINILVLNFYKNAWTYNLYIYILLRLASATGKKM